MDKLTTERLEELRDHYLGMVNKDVGNALTRLLAYEQAAKNPVAWRVSSFAGLPTVTFYEDVKDSMIANGQNPVPLYAAPVLPKQPNATLTDEGTKIIKAAEKLVRCKGRYHSEQNYSALAALFGVTIPDLPPLPSDEVPVQSVIPRELCSFVTDADIAALHRFAECCDDPESGGHDLEKEQVQRLEKIGALQRSGRISYITDFGDYLISATAPINAQPVSEPYKLKDAVVDIRNSGVEIDADKIKAERDALNSPVIPDGSAGTNCIWSTDSDGIWLGDCGVTWQFFDDGPDENGLKYCPSCGKKISVITAPAQEQK